MPSVKGLITALEPTASWGYSPVRVPSPSVKVSWKAEGTFTLASTQPSVSRVASGSGSREPPS